MAGEQEKKGWPAGAQAAGVEAAKRSRVVNALLETYIRGTETGDTKPRGAVLVEELYKLAMKSEDDRVRLAAIKEIIDRVDGKSVERKEVRNMRIEGIVYLPPAEDIKAVN
jgi:hypothetical protein